ncbi:MAG TPA: DinB family protein [Pyrinomonadaceae bacterium]|nr:DinB family protein [Pyrinomonadaceae bacterium]
MSESATAPKDDYAISRRFITQAIEFLLNDYLPKIERCLEKLTDEQIWWRANEESNSIGNLILHLCGNARQWIICGVGSQPDQRNRDAEFAQRDSIPRAELLSLLRSTLSEIQTTLLALDPTTILERRKIQGHDVDILEAIFHVTEHFSMHTGQIIMLTKMLTSSDLRFYGFEDGVPVERWHSGPSGSS